MSGVVDIHDRVVWQTNEVEASFAYTPIASDVGEHTLDFSVSDGIAIDIEVVAVTVTLD